MTNAASPSAEFNLPHQTTLPFSDRTIAMALLVLCVVTRWLAIPASLWEWDDLLFARALHQYDLVTHSPHPPGFPVFVVLTRIAYWLVHSEYQALTGVAFLFAIFLAPALFYLFREIFEDTPTALASALLGSFIPSVWVHSAAGRSDGPGLVLGVAALALLLKGRSSNRALYWGCLVLGLGMGVRVTVMVVAAPMLGIVLLQRLRNREWHTVSLALLIVGLSILSWYVPLIWHETWERYSWVVNQHRRFIWEKDSIFAHTENAVVSYRLRRFFIDAWGAPWIAWTTYSLALLGTLSLCAQKKWRTLGWLTVAFAPFLVFIFITTTPLGAPLYAQPYLPLFTGLAAFGLVQATSLLFKYERLATLGLWLAVGLTVAFAQWGYPAVKLIHQQVSPTMQAMRFLQKTLDPQKHLLMFDEMFEAHTEFFFPKFKGFWNLSDLMPENNLLNPILAGHSKLMLTGTPTNTATEHHFSWLQARGARRLRTMSLGRYFDVYVAEPSAIQNVLYLNGWYEPESTPESTWRWMGTKAQVAIRGAGQQMQLHFKGGVVAVSKSPAIITMKLNGETVDRFPVTDLNFERNITVKTDQTQLWSKLTIEIDKAVIPSKIDAQSGDTRELGLRCSKLEWENITASSITNRSSEQYLGEGWTPLEQQGASKWRRINGTAEVHLPAMVGDAEFILRLAGVPQEQVGHVSAKVEIDGHELEPFVLESGEFTHTVRVPASMHGEKPAELKLRFIVNPAVSSFHPENILVVYLGWQPALNKTP